MKFKWQLKTVFPLFTVNKNQCWINENIPSASQKQINPEIPSTLLSCISFTRTKTAAAPNTRSILQQQGSNNKKKGRKKGKLVSGFIRTKRASAMKVLMQAIVKCKGAGCASSRWTRAFLVSFIYCPWGVAAWLVTTLMAILVQIKIEYLKDC